MALQGLALHLCAAAETRSGSRGHSGDLLSHPLPSPVLSCALSLYPMPAGGVAQRAQIEEMRRHIRVLLADAGVLEVVRR